jgi:hypothetical protein
MIAYAFKILSFDASPPLPSLLFSSLLFSSLPLGPLDAGTSVALPRRPVPDEFTRSLRERVRHVTFASNPCRVRYFTQEIVLFRADLLKDMQRHLAVPLVLDGPDVIDITEQLVQSVLDQAHLCPLPLHAKPIYWELDYTMRLFPLPHLVTPYILLIFHAATTNVYLRFYWFVSSRIVFFF